jgi:hypothetical protein
MQKAIPVFPVSVFGQSGISPTQPTLWFPTLTQEFVIGLLSFLVTIRNDPQNILMFIPCQWSLLRYVYSQVYGHPHPDIFYLQLATGQVPFYGSPNQNVLTMVTSGKRPQRPRRFNAPGITSAVWTVADKCWNQEAEERPDVRIVVDALKQIASAGKYLVFTNSLVFTASLC